MPKLTKNGKNRPKMATGRKSAAVKLGVPVHFFQLILHCYMCVCPQKGISSHKQSVLILYKTAEVWFGKGQLWKSENPWSVELLENQSDHMSMTCVNICLEAQLVPLTYICQ